MFEHRSHGEKFSPVLFTCFLLYCAFLSLFSMGGFRVGSLNVNGFRDRGKQAVFSEFFNLKRLNVCFLQETHTDDKSVSDWGLWWKGQFFLSHGTNVSAGVAILFSYSSAVSVLSFNEVVAGRLLVVRAKFHDHVFNFINVYAPNKGSERSELFTELGELLQSLSSEDTVILGGDWNCTLDFVKDRNGAEPHLQSALSLASIVSTFDLVDAWREKNPSVRQYSWVKVDGRGIFAARLDRFYVSGFVRNKIARSCIQPTSFSDHHLCFVDFSFTSYVQRSCLWYFNRSLLQDKTFYESFKLFWAEWVLKKVDYPTLLQWWDVGKAHIRVFCQDFTSYSTSRLKTAIHVLEKDITRIHNLMLNQNGSDFKPELTMKLQELGDILNEKAKSALVRHRFMSVQNMDAPTAFFFNLEKSSHDRQALVSVRKDDGTITTDPVEVRRLAVDFYSDLFTARAPDQQCLDILFDVLPQLGEERQLELDTALTFEEVTEAVHQLTPGKAPGIDGLPVDFYRTFWGIIGRDLYEVLMASFNDGVLPTSCQRAVLSLIPKKGDLCLLKNWRPVSLLCTDYKILSRCLANRLKTVLDVIITADQSYCIPERTIYDNLFLIRDLFDYAKISGSEFGLLSLDQEKAFDRVDHDYLFSTLQAFGFGNVFISWVKLLYTHASCLVKAGGGLSTPVQVGRGIRQGCPLSGQLYSIAVEPFLCLIRKKLAGLQVGDTLIKVSAYADDLTVVICHEQDVSSLSDALQVYEMATSAKLNWSKTEALWCGSGSRDVPLPTLPGGIKWSRTGLKFLGVWLGNDEVKARNWEGIVEKVRARLSRWSWLMPQLSFRGRVLVTNNLIASALWHRFTVLDPPRGLISDVQRELVSFFWSGQHWLRASVLYLPVQEGGQGLIDVLSRVAVLRLQTLQRLLYGERRSWMEVACVFLRAVGRLGLDKHLFSLQLKLVDLQGLPPFYSAVVEAWGLFSISRDCATPSAWTFDESLFFNPAFPSLDQISGTVRGRLLERGISKLCHLRRGVDWVSAEELAEMAEIRSVRLAMQILERLRSDLSPSVVDFLTITPVEQRECTGRFPELVLEMGQEGWQEGQGTLLSLDLPTLGLFSGLHKRALYLACVKTVNFRCLKDVQETKWADFVGADSSPRQSWRSLYKRPIEKRVGDLQWRLVHGILSTNRHLARIDPSVSDRCPFCGVSETLFHVFCQCSRLGPLSVLLKDWGIRFLGKFDIGCFIYGPKYSVANKNKVIILNFLYGAAKLAIWCTRKNRIKGRGGTDPVLMVRGLVMKRLMVEFTYYSLIDDVDSFFAVWGVGSLLCEPDDFSGFVLNV